MRSTTTKIAIAIGLMSTFLPQMASATAAPSFSCSANLVVSLDNGYKASCDGDFSFTDGVLQNDTMISLTAGGYLTIGANASLYAPLINLYSPNIHINTGAIIDAGNFLNPGAVYIGAGNIDAGKGRLTISDEPAKLISVINSGAFIGLGTYTQPTVVSSGGLSNVGGTLVIKSPTLDIANSVLNPDGTIFIAVSPVPEPSTYALMVLGLASLGLRRKSKTP